MKKQLKKVGSQLKNLVNKLTIEDPIEKQLREIKELQKLGFRDFQNIENLIEVVEVGQTISAAGNPSKLVSVTDEEIEWETIIPPSGSFGSHWHLEEEYCTVLKGVLVDELNPDKKYYAGETLFVPGKTRHVPANPSTEKNLLLKVIFKRIQ